jgi:glycerate 2-kinase
MQDADARMLLGRMFDAAIAVADPRKIVPRNMPVPPCGRTVVVGAGKASAAMARAFEENWPGELSGLIVTRYGHAVPCRRIEVVEAAHPVPDPAGARAAQRILERVSNLEPDDLVVALISGGGSSLLAAPAPGLTLADKQAVNRALLASGASITEINCVRKHLSAIKGGRLAAAAYPARVGDPTTFEDAVAILLKYGISEPESVIAHLTAAVDETPKPGDWRLSRTETQIIATPQLSLLAAAEVALSANVTPVILGDAIEGEAREVPRVMAGIAHQVRRYRQPFPAPCVLLSGGETSVTIRGKGRGGRNVEFLLALALALDGADDVWATAGDTDGVDGAADVAGAVIAPDTLVSSRRDNRFASISTAVPATGRPACRIGRSSPRWRPTPCSCSMTEKSDRGSCGCPPALPIPLWKLAAVCRSARASTCRRRVAFSSLTEKDRCDLEFGLSLGIDWVALSFVQRPEDVDEARH